MSEPYATSDIGRYAIVPEWLILNPAVPPQAFRLFALIAAKYADRETGAAYPSRATLADDLGTSMDTVDRAAASLIDAGAMTVTPRWSDAGDRTSNLYHLIFMRPGSRTDAVTGSTSDAATGSRTDAARSRSGSDPESVEPVSYTDARASRTKIEPLTDPQRAILGNLHGQVRDGPLAGSTAPELNWCEHLIRRGATQTDVDHAVHAAAARNVRGRGSMSYIATVLESRVAQREAGDDPDAISAGDSSRDRNRAGVSRGGFDARQARGQGVARNGRGRISQADLARFPDRPPVPKSLNAISRADDGMVPGAG